MNERDEQRVIEALQTLTGGLIVTEHDILTAGGRLRDRLDAPPPRRRTPLLVAAAAVALLLVGYVVSQALDRGGDAAPPVNQPVHTPADDLTEALRANVYTVPEGRFTAGAAPGMSDLTGLWLLRDPFGFVMFVQADGAWHLDTPTGTLAFGGSTLNGDTLTRRLDNRSGCAQGNQLLDYVQRWRAALAQDGSLRLLLTDDNTTCTPATEREVWDRVGPGSPVGGYLLATARDADWQSAPARLAWEGLYVAPETGHVLAVDGQGRYRYYDAPAERLDDADRGELKSRQGEVSGTCDGGTFSGTLEVARFPGVPGYVSEHEAIRIDTTSTGCASGVSGEGVWVNLTPQ